MTHERRAYHWATRREGADLAWEAASRLAREPYPIRRIARLLLTLSTSQIRRLRRY
jgi:hypothetical protein